MKRYLFLLLLLVGAAARAQDFSFEHWHGGYLIVEGGDTLKGLVKYNLETDLIQLQVNNRLETFTARKVVFFEIFDVLTKDYRRFYSLPYALSSGYRAPTFFELLTEGKMTLLARENLEYKTYSSFYYYGSYTRLVLVYKYYLLEENGEIKEFQGKKNDWIYAMGNYGDEVQKYVKSNKLDFDDKKDLTRIVEYYNTFFKN
ncbi:MAG TPA: hypothetical protein VK508_02940 [Cyclobacteriaceae bacterium]|nr:hypothetical protein [Cyclobacteriaceae bacterium]